MQATVAETGLRQAKIQRTRLRVEKAAVELALQHGSEHVTVDQICEAADISARTFFNYFGSKEVAIVGPANKTPDEDLLEEFVAKDGPLLADFLHVFVENVRRKEPDVDLIKARRALFDKEPQLSAQRMNREANARSLYTDVITRRLLRQDPSLGLEEATAEATIAVAVALGVMHAAGAHWIDSDGTADIDPLINTALERVKRLV